MRLNPKPSRADTDPGPGPRRPQARPQARPQCRPSQCQYEASGSSIGSALRKPTSAARSRRREHRELRDLDKTTTYFNVSKLSLILAGQSQPGAAGLPFTLSIYPCISRKSL